MTPARNIPSLNRVQTDFLGYIRGDDAAMAGKVRDTRKAAAETLLGVYRNAYALRLIEALGTNYPVLKRVLGDEEFDLLGRDYVGRHPSRHFSIRWYGDKLAAFLDDKPALAELAAFEWGLAAAFDAADAAALDVPALAAIAPADWPGLVFAFHPSLTSLTSRWDVPEQWKRLSEDAAAEVSSPTPRDTPVDFALWRQDGQTYFRSLTADEAQMLALARSGATFAALCEALCAHVPEDQAGQRAAELLRGWVEQGWITGAGKS